MESLLTRIMETGSKIANVDNTGVSNVDTVVVQHLMKTATAARLMDRLAMCFQRGCGIRSDRLATGHGTSASFCEIPGRNEMNEYS
jgi:hypothetical protein